MIKGGRSINSLAALFAKRLANNDISPGDSFEHGIRKQKKNNASEDNLPTTVERGMSGGSVEQLLKTEDITVDNIIKEVEFEHQDAVFKDVDFSNVVVGTLNDSLNQIGGSVTNKEHKELLTGGADLEEMKENIFAGGCQLDGEPCAECIGEQSREPSEAQTQGDTLAFDNDDIGLTGGARKITLPNITNDNSEEIIENILIDARAESMLDESGYKKVDDKTGDEIIGDILIDACKRKGCKKCCSKNKGVHGCDVNNSKHENIIENILIDAKAGDKLNDASDDVSEDDMKDGSCSSGSSSSSSSSSESGSDDDDSDVGSHGYFSEDDDEMNSDAPEPEDFIKDEVEFNDDEEDEDDNVVVDGKGRTVVGDETHEDVEHNETLAEIMAAIHRAHSRQRMNNASVRNESVDIVSRSNNNGAMLQQVPYMVGGARNKKKVRYCKVINMYPWVVSDDSDEE